MAGHLEGWLRVLAVALLGALVPGVVWAQHITIDGTLSKAQTLAGPNYAITANLGKQVGGNLFHSFGIFGLSQGESASFSGPATVANIIGRVTGGTPSSVDGSIKSSIAGANLYLINPGGLVFGPHATVNVSGSFHASTADYLRLSDGAKFQATNPSGSTLSAAAPAAFGFLNASPAAITVNGSRLGPVPATLGVVAGPVTINNAAVLSAPAGTIHVTAVAGTGEVPVDPTQISALTVTRFAAVNISGGSKLSVSDPTHSGSGGSVFIRAGSLTIDAGNLDGDNYGTGPGGQLNLHADGQVDISNGARVHGLALSSGTGASIAVTAGALTILSNGAIEAISTGSGNAGTVSLSVAGALTIDGTNSNPSLLTGVTSQANAGSTGNAGIVTVSAGSLSIDNLGKISSRTSGSGNGGDVSVAVSGQMTIDGTNSNPLFITGITSQAQPGSTGTAGAVTITAGSLSIVDIGNITSSTFGTGRGGNVSVTVANGLSIDGAGRSAISTGIRSRAEPGSSGDAGSVTVSADTITIIDNGQISGSAFGGAGNANAVTVSVAGALTIDGSQTNPSSVTGITSQANSTSTGNAGTVTVSAGSLSLIDNGQVSSSTGGRGAGGNVALHITGDVTIAGAGGAITASANAGSQGNAGEVTLAAGGALTLSGGGQISSATAGAGNGGAVAVSAAGPLAASGSGSGITALATATADGNAGSVTVSAPRITITSGAAIASTTAGTGAGGSVVVTTPGALLLDGNGVPGTQIAASATGAQSKNGGPVTVEAGALTIRGGADIASSSAGVGKGGDVVIRVASTILLPDPGTQISARSTGTGDAGSITVKAANLRMNDDAAISTEGGTANGGNITLNVGKLMFLGDSKITTSVAHGLGNGGNITIDPVFVVLDHSSIIAQADIGNGGNITIVANEYLASPDSIVSASSALGISGTVDIVGPRTDLNSSLVILPSDLGKAAAVLRNSCAARGALTRSSLTEAGRGGLPQDPDEMIPALYLAGRDAKPASAGSAAPVGRAHVGTHVGVLHLTTRCS